ncbi:hypothetical protein [uncultured Eudoraea sp.]|uniref:hypothetical protein n=1 Tax=uncultured Eudoraea sp. TaxID=1035614 RepID=UPI00260A1615|nr:hypothetical protein [uncultured Eudoraea sp.]
MSRYFLLIFLILFAKNMNSQVSTEQLVEDIDQLYSLIITEHVDPYWNNSKDNFLKTIKNAKEIIQKKETCDESCYVEIFKIVAALNESHSYVSSKSRYKLFGYLPITIKWFEDGLFVVKTSTDYEELLGHKIISINGTDIKEVFEKIKLVIPHTNSSRIKKYIGSYLHLPGLLYGLGISDKSDEAKFTLEKNGTQIRRLVKNLSPEDEENTTFKTIPGGDTYFQRNLSDYYWFDYNSEQKLVYFQYNRIGNMESESSTAFANRLWAAVDSVAVDKFVLDLRYNGGGSFPYSLKFIQGIVDRPKINKRGKLFIITGYDTFSAAITMVNQLEQRTEAIIIGEYPCASPSHPGDPENYTLENSGIEVSLSSLYHPTVFMNDKRNATILDKHFQLFWDDYNKGIDPNIDFILNYKDGNLPAKLSDFPNIIGTYEYSIIRNMQIKEIDGKIYLEIDGALFSPLYADSAGIITTEINGLSLSMHDGYIVLNFPDGKTEKFYKIDSSTNSAIDYLYKGDIANAENIYVTIKKSDPDNIELQDHQMSFLASIIYFDLRNKPEVDASSIAKNILNLGIKLNKGKAPFCEFSLRFY